MRRSALQIALDLLKGSMSTGGSAFASATSKAFFPSTLATTTSAKLAAGPQSPASSLLASLLRTRDISTLASTFLRSQTTSKPNRIASLLSRYSKLPHRQLQPSRGVRSAMSFPPRSPSPNNFKTWQARFNPDASKVIWSLIAVNGAVYMLWRVDPYFAARHFVVSLDSLRAGRFWTALTAAFSQTDTMHLASNMITLYFFGSDIGRIFGGKKLLLLYVFGGIAGSLAHCGQQYYKEQKLLRGRSGKGGRGKNVYWGLNSALSSGYGGSSKGALGASAAVSAISVVDIALFPTRTILLYGLIPMPAALLGLLWLWNDIGGTLDGRGSTIAHAGHLGGAATGVAFYVAFRRGLIRPHGWW